MQGSSASSDVVSPGTRLGVYRIESLIGTGSMAEVYRAVEEPAGRVVALKTLRPCFASNPVFTKRFLREARIVSSLASPHTVLVHDGGQTAEGTLFLAMELLDGESLRQLLRREGALEPGVVAEIAAQVCESLIEAHGKGIVHRDLKPDNIFVSLGPDGSILTKVLDFGVARLITPSGAPALPETVLTQVGAVVGTPAYMAPEQARGEAVDARTDLYAVGVLLFEMLSGGQPFQDANPLRLLHKQMNDAPPPLYVVRSFTTPVVLESLIGRLLEKAPERRPRDAATVQQILRQFVEGERCEVPSTQGPPTTPIDVPTDPGLPPPSDATAPDAGRAALAGVLAREGLETLELPPSEDGRESQFETKVADRARDLGMLHGRPAAGVTPAAPPSVRPTRSRPLSETPMVASGPPNGPARARQPGWWWAVPLPAVAILLAALALPSGRRTAPDPAPPPSTRRAPASHRAQPRSASAADVRPVAPRRVGSGTPRAATTPAVAPTAPEAIPEPSETAAQSSLVASWTGVYRGRNGPLRIVEEGGELAGFFSVGGEAGRLRGHAEGDVLSFRWRLGAWNETPPPDGRGRGVLHRTVGADGTTHLEGTFGYGERESGGGDWTAVRR